MNQEELGTEKISKLLRAMALPLIIAQIVNGLYNLVDRVFLGHIEGEGAMILTGVGLTYPVILIISAFSSLIGNGGAPRAATCLGQGNRKRAEEILSTCAISLLALSFVLMALFYIIKEPLLYIFGASDATAGYGDEYLSTYLLGTPFVLLTLGLNPFISMQGNTTLSMLTVIIGAVLNLILDPVFIFLFGMGAGGAALATVISQGASAVYVVMFLMGRRSTLHLSFAPSSFRHSVLKPVITLGMSPFAMGLTEAAMSFVFTSRLQAISGDLAVGAMTILSSMLNFAMMPVTGMNQALIPIVSYNFGAGRKDRVMQAFRIALKVALIYTAAVSILCNTFPADDEVLHHRLHHLRLPDSEPEHACRPWASGDVPLLRVLQEDYPPHTVRVHPLLHIAWRKRGVPCRVVRGLDICRICVHSLHAYPEKDTGKGRGKALKAIIACSCLK